MDTKGTLARIAQILGVPVETFVDGAGGVRADEAAEVLRLFARIQCPAERRAILDFLRAVGDRQRPAARAASR